MEHKLKYLIYLKNYGILDYFTTMAELIALWHYDFKIAFWILIVMNLVVGHVRQKKISALEKDLFGFE